MYYVLRYIFFSINYLSIVCKLQRSRLTNTKPQWRFEKYEQGSASRLSCITGLTSKHRYFESPKTESLPHFATPILLLAFRPAE